MKKKSTDNYVEGKKIKQMKNTIKHYDFSNKLSIRKIKKNVEIWTKIQNGALYARFRSLYYESNILKIDFFSVYLFINVLNFKAGHRLGQFCCKSILFFRASLELLNKFNFNNTGQNSEVGMQLKLLEAAWWINLSLDEIRATYVLIRNEGYGIPSYILGHEETRILSRKKNIVSKLTTPRKIFLLLTFSFTY